MLIRNRFSGALLSDIPAVCPHCNSEVYSVQKYGWGSEEKYYKCGTIIGVYFRKLDVFGTHEIEVEKLLKKEI
jgi:hypothetical protein